MSFRITSITTRIVDHPLIASRIVISPAGRHESSRFLAIMVHDEIGACGYGEAATTALWSGETAETARSLVEELFAPKLRGHSFEHPSEVLALLDGMAYGAPFTKSALETAVWDMWARRQHVPATALFGDRPPVAWIATRASVGCYDVAQTARIADEFYAAGIRILKFKFGIAGMDDAARLRAVRERLGDDVVFTVDANGAFASADEAVRAIEALLPYDLALVEQPTPRERISLLAEVKKRVEVPILADECVFNQQHLREVLDCDACDYVSLYPGKNGGLTHTLEMARLAQAAGKPCAIGSNLESDLGQAAMAAAAAALSAFPVEQLACDLPAALFYQSSSVREPLELRGGKIAVPQGEGFGVTPRCFDGDQEKS